MEREVKFEFNPRRIIAGDAGFVVGPIGASGEPAGAVYVDRDGGDDANPGTEVSPIRSLYEAIWNRPETSIILMTGDVAVIGNVDLDGKTLFIRDGVGIRDDFFGARLGTSLSSFYPPLNQGTYISATPKGSALLLFNNNLNEWADGSTSTPIAQTPTGDLVAKVQAAFPDLTNVVLGGVSASLYNPTDKHILFSFTADSAIHSLTGADILVSFDIATFSANYYYHVDNVFDLTFHGGGPASLSTGQILHPGNEAGTDYLFAQRFTTSGSGRTLEFVAIKPNKGPVDLDWRENVETPDFGFITAATDPTDRKNAVDFGMSRSMPVGGVAQWVYPDRSFFANTDFTTDGFILTLDQIVTDMISAGGTWASLNFLVRRFMYDDDANSRYANQGHALEMYYSGQVGERNSGDFNFTAIKYGQDNIRQRWNGNFFWNPFHSDIVGPSAFDPSPLPGTAPVQDFGVSNRTDFIFNNGTVLNWNVTVRDPIFGQPGSNPVFRNRNSNFLSIASDSTLRNCELIGPSGAFRLTETGFEVAPFTAAVTKGRIERSNISNFFNGNNWRNIFALPNDICIDTLFVQMAIPANHSRLESCSVLNCYNVFDNGGNTIDFDYLGINARDIVGPFVGGGLNSNPAYSLTDSVIRQGDGAGLIHGFVTQTNVQVSDPFYKSNVTPYNLRIQAFAKGDPLNSPAVGLTSKPSIHGGDRESGAFDDDSTLIELYEAVTIFAPWVARLPAERESNTNKLESGRRPSLALSGQTLKYQFRWELALTNTERQYLNRIVQANSTKIRFYPKPIEKPSVFLEGHIETKTDYSSPRAVVDSAASSLFLTVNFESPDPTIDINDYL